jgi:hypothetical protein
MGCFSGRKIWNAIPAEKCQMLFRQKNAGCYSARKMWDAIPPEK